MENNKRCVICGKPGEAKMKNSLWLCGQCAMAATIGSLAAGVPVVMARKGIPQLLLLPPSRISNN